MSKYKKKDNEVAVAQLSDNLSLLIKKATVDSTEMMTAIGVMVQMYTLGAKEHEIISKDKFKEMMNKFIDKVWSD